MLRRNCAALTALLSIAFAPAVRASDLNDACWRADEARASRIQALQTMLMVDAIKCQDTVPGTLASYNAFMTDRHDMLLANKYMVQAYFVRTLGPVDGAKASTDNDTLVANRLSSDAIDVRRCETTGMYTRAAAQATDDDLLTMATILTKDADVNECPILQALPARPAAMIIPVWKKPQPALQASPSDGSPGQSAAVASPSALGTAATAAAIEPTSVSKSGAVTDGTAPVAGNERAETLKALNAAVLALNQVASSLAPASSESADQEN